MTSSKTTRRVGARLATGLLMASLALGTIGATGATAVTGYSTDTSQILFNVPPEDLIANRHGICNGTFKYVMRNVGGAAGAIRYLNAAQKCGLQAILFFSDTANHTTGKVYPSRVGALVRAVKSHPALYGYLTVKEPSWVHISGAEIRSLYRAFKAADPNRPVVALFGDIPHFGDKANPYTAGMADIVMVDWYPVETANNGCSRSGSHYITNGPKWFKKVRAKIDRVTPGTPAWLMVQTHKYLAPRCHKKQRPTEAQLRRQVRDGLQYLKASGIAYHTFRNTNYSIDLHRDGTMVKRIKTLSGQIKAGTFR